MPMYVVLCDNQIHPKKPLSFFAALNIILNDYQPIQECSKYKSRTFIKSKKVDCKVWSISINKTEIKINSK